jgi:hypothetical protein
MAKFGYTLSGSAPVMKRFKIQASFATAGIFAIGGATTESGCKPSTSTSVADSLGLTLDTATYTTTKAVAMVEGVVTVCINPDLIAEFKMANGATAGTVCVATTASAAQSTGLDVTITTGDPAPNSPEMIDGTIIGISGANVGLSRIITASSATKATVTVPFANSIASGDKFLLVPWQGMGTVAKVVNLTSNFAEARHDIAVATGAALRPIEFKVDFSSATAALRNSFLYVLNNDHVLNTAT